jgi:Pyridoxamine 5'-phosphate oxidase
MKRTSAATRPPDRKNAMVTRPHMPGYGILPADKGRGLLPWSFAAKRLRDAHTYWIASVSPEAAPHVMPVWGLWMDEAFWFSTGKQSRKSRNLQANPRCVVCCEAGGGQVVLQGSVRLNSEAKSWKEFARAYKKKYDFDMSSMAEEPVYVVSPAVVFGLSEKNFVGTATRWKFAGAIENASAAPR